MYQKKKGSWGLQHYGFRVGNDASDRPFFLILYKSNTHTHTHTPSDFPSPTRRPREKKKKKKKMHAWVLDCGCMDGERGGEGCMRGSWRAGKRPTGLAGVDPTG